MTVAPLTFLWHIWLTLAHAYVPHPVRLTGHPRFDWHNLATADNLNFSPCYDEFECARLSLPLDWHNASSPHNISLAVIMLRAVVPQSHPSHGGSVIVNPGGPGGSGVLYALSAARKLQTLLDGPQHYDIISFDPRGVLYSQPNAYCFDEAIESEIWYREKRAAGGLNASEAALRYSWAAEIGRGRLCATNKGGIFSDGINIRNHLSTAYTARDMLELVFQLDDVKLSGAKHATQEVLSEKHVPKLQYMGTSYGTFLGETFAALYPEHVSRMVLDSNIDADNFVSRHEASVDDHEAIRSYFFERCYAGGEKCAFWRTSDRGAGDIQARYEVLRSMVQHEPVSFTGAGHTSVITFEDLQDGWFMTFYQPAQFFPLFAQFLNALYEARDLPYPFWHHALNLPGYADEAILAHILQNSEISAAVHCSDGPDLTSSNVSLFQDWLSNLMTRFPNAGTLQAEWKLSCFTLPASLRPQWRYDGPFNATVPILFVNNRLDPATPLKSARRMATQYDGSSVLVQDSVGHGALLPGGECTWNHVKRYMQTGRLPESGTVCEVPCEPFDEGC
ncbi:hypothetical protein LTR17_020116 [Elasticomyces elasticus]|nr:hypothetical protein LTR17_020116 [Elasticomyces elasticus]